MLLTGSQFRALTQQAKKEKWGIGAFNVSDIDTAEMVFDAAEETMTPVIIQTVDYEKLKEIDPRNQFVAENFESYKDRAENGGGFASFFKSIFGKRMG